MARYTGKTIVVGVCGSIAAFKVAGWVSKLAQNGASVSVVMTEAGTKFVTPLTFAALSGNPVAEDMFRGEEVHAISHVDLGKRADLLLIAPATANTIAKLAHGFADDLLGSTVLAADCPVLIAPAMNTKMLANPATQDNLRILQERGYTIINPAYGQMACKTEGAGRLAEWEDAEEMIVRAFTAKDLVGQTFLITAGPTREDLDPARFLSNRSSGKMGFALARMAKRRGAEVILVAGPSALGTPSGVKRVDVVSASEMYSTVMAKASACSVIVKAAAVCDFRPQQTFAEKVKKGNADSVLPLEQTDDILFELGQQKKKYGYLLVGFAAESVNLREAGENKLKNKNLDLICINAIGTKNSGFATSTNQVTMLDHSGFVDLPLSSKEVTADLILDRICSHLRAKE